MDVCFTVPLAPCPKGRPRATLTAKGIRAHTPRKTSAWEQWFAYFADVAMPKVCIDEPVRVDTLFVLRRPKLPASSSPGLVWAPVRPDIDNLQKSVLDALAFRWRDDALVVAGEALKVYAELGGKPRVVVRVRSVDGTPESRAANLGLLEEVS